jgi:glyoxylase-like metal-dependent hydrolase (beta-lactamase superfamily II)
MEIIPNVHLIPNIIANPYLIIDADGLTLIDAGLPGNHKKILDYISGLGRSPSDLKRIIITHSDLDHFGSLPALKKASGARVYASQIEADGIARGKSTRQIKSTQSPRKLAMKVVHLFMRPAPVQSDEILSDGQVLPILGGLRVVETPGHTPGHISLFSPLSGILFSGDSIISRVGMLVKSAPANTWDEAQAADSARRQASLGAKIVCPGHGSVVREASGKFPQV